MKLAQNTLFLMPLFISHTFWYFLTGEKPAAEESFPQNHPTKTVSDEFVSTLPTLWQSIWQNLCQNDLAIVRVCRNIFTYIWYISSECHGGVICACSTMYDITPCALFSLSSLPMEWREKHDIMNICGVLSCHQICREFGITVYLDLLQELHRDWWKWLLLEVQWCSESGFPLCLWWNKQEGGTYLLCGKFTWKQILSHVKNGLFPEAWYGLIYNKQVMYLTNAVHTVIFLQIT